MKRLAARQETPRSQPLGNTDGVAEEAQLGVTVLWNKRS